MRLLVCHRRHCGRSLADNSSLAGSTPEVLDQRASIVVSEEASAWSAPIRHLEALRAAVEAALMGETGKSQDSRARLGRTGDINDKDRGCPELEKMRHLPGSLRQNWLKPWIRLHARAAEGV